MALVVSWYRSGLESLHPATWDARVDDKVLAIEHGMGWSFDATDTTLTDLALGGCELTAIGYSRATLTTGTPVFSSGRWTLPLSAVVWPSCGTAEQVAAFVGYEAGVDDASSVPLWVLRDSGGAAIVTLDGTDLTLSMDLGVT